MSVSLNSKGYYRAMAPLTDKQLEHFQANLESLREELDHLLAISSQATDVVILDQSRVGRLSRMDAIQQQQMSQASRAAYRQRLLAVDRALALLSEGEYGWCVTCGEDIDPRRLEIQPESVLCVSCQQLTETVV